MRPPPRLCSGCSGAVGATGEALPSPPPRRADAVRSWDGAGGRVGTRFAGGFVALDSARRFYRAVLATSAIVRVFGGRLCVREWVKDLHLPRRPLLLPKWLKTAFTSTGT